MDNNGTVQLEDTICIVHSGKYNDNYIGLNATVTEILADNRIRTKMMYFNPSIDVEDEIVLVPGAYELIALHPYDVTVCHTGYVPNILAGSENQAIKIFNMFITANEVSWSEDWPATYDNLEDKLT